MHHAGALRQVAHGGKDALESGSAHEKAEAMEASAILLSGEQMPQIFITIVRFVLPSEDKYVQKRSCCWRSSRRRTRREAAAGDDPHLQNLRNNLQHPGGSSAVPPSVSCAGSRSRRSSSR